MNMACQSIERRLLSTAALLGPFLALVISVSGPASAQLQAASLTITPSTLVLLVGETAAVSVVDESGRPVSAVQWTISAPITALHPEDNQIQLDAEQTGRAVLTATVSDSTATAVITVVAGENLPPMTVKWSLDPTPGYETLLLRQAVPSESMPDMYSIEWSKSSNAIVRALGGTGQQLWMTKLSSIASPQYLNREMTLPLGTTSSAQKEFSNFGQLLLLDGGGFVGATKPAKGNPEGIPPDGQSFLTRAVGDFSGGLQLLERGHATDSMVSLNGKDGSELWRYRSPGRLGKDWTSNYNHDIGIVETLADPVGSALLILDDRTGKVRFRIPLPNSSTTIKNLKCISGNDISNVRAARAGSILTSSDGNIYVQVEVHNEMSDALPCKTGQYVFDNSISLLKITPDGKTEWKTFIHIHSDANGNYVAQPRVFAGETIPDGLGGVLAAWTYASPGNKEGEKPHFEARLTRINSSDQFDYTLPMPGWTANPMSVFDENMVLGEQDILYATDNHILISFDIKSGEMKWARHPPTGEIAIDWSTSGGGVLVTNAGRFVSFNIEGDGQALPWTVEPANQRDIGLAQLDPFDGTPALPLQLRDLQLSWHGDFFAVEDGAPSGRGAVMQFVISR
jgi:hypothetical protein